MTKSTRQEILSFRIIPPPGMSPIRGSTHKFRKATVAKFKATAQNIADRAVEEIKRDWSGVYPLGEGTVKNSIRINIEGGENGIAASISAAGRQLRYMTTAVPDSDYRPGPYIIYPTNREFLVYFSRKWNRWVKARFARHPGFPGRDLITEVAERYGLELQEELLAAHDRAMVEVTQSGGSPVIQNRRIS